MKEIELVLFKDNDYKFVYETKKEAYKEYVIECWGEWDENLQQEHFQKFINTYRKSLYIIKLDNKSIGFYNDYEEDDYYEIGNICIIPEYQGKGIGTNILMKKIEEHTDKDIKIQYFKQNPVGRLYKRLGFINNGETRFHFQMIRKRMKDI